jgi:hypothetical protein
MPHPKEDPGLSPEELEAQEAEQLPDREVMSTLDPPIPVGRIPYDELSQPPVDQSA